MATSPITSTLRPASTYPLFCPRCGRHREVQITDNTECPISQCLKCGFRWNRIKNPEMAIKEALIDLSDFDLINILRLLSQAQKSLYTHVAKQVAKDPSTVQYVFEGKKGNPDVLKAILTEIRSRLGFKPTQPELSKAITQEQNHE